ncbi:MAG: phosphohistidine phosphatase SixA [bacterium]|nr:phosphohistidine phosphatase SixA [bacterium]
MKIFLIRHAEAIDLETDSSMDDEDRFITSKGRITTIEVAEILKDEFKKLDRIFTSPLIRAVQTAEIFAVKLRFRNEVEVINEMKNESPTASLQELISIDPDLTSIALVGHEPKMGMLVKIFSGKDDLPEFSKSSICLIDFDVTEGKGKFVWYFDADKMEIIR